MSAALLCALVQACGSTSNSPSTVSASAGMVGASTAGAGGAGLDVGGATANAGSSGGAGLAGSAGSSGGATSATGGAGSTGQAGSSSSCPSGMATVSGIWNSAAWQESYTSSPGFQSYTGASGAAWQFHSLLNPDDGYLLLRGQGASPNGDGMAHAATVLFETPAAGPTPGGWYCSSSGSSVIDTTLETQIMLENLGRLGACGGGEGVPVSGQVSICNADMGFPADCHLTRSGTLDGMTISTTSWDGSQGTRLDNLDLLFPDGMVISYYRMNEFDPTGSDTNGFVITPDGTVYCAGAASGHTDTNGQTIDTLTDFKRLGSCASITGMNTMQGCFGKP